MATVLGIVLMVAITVVALYLLTRFAPTMPEGYDPPPLWTLTTVKRTCVRTGDAAKDCCDSDPTLHTCTKSETLC